jgi:hypothetical protein
LIYPGHVPRHPVTVRRQGKEVVETEGGIFADSPKLKAARGGRPPFIYAMGPPEAKQKTPVFTCPRFVVPEWMWGLLDLWWYCRHLGALPFAGGVVDQPVVVRRAFAVWNAEMERIERSRAAAGRGAELAAAMAGGLAQIFGARR